MTGVKRSLKHSYDSASHATTPMQRASAEFMIPGDRDVSFAVAILQ